VVRVRVDDQASVFLDAYPSSELSGRVAKIAAAADPATGTYEMEVLVEPGELRLVSGLVARTQVRDGRESARPAVPLTALLEADGGKAVAYVVDRQRLVARRVVVSIGRFAGDRVEITGGLELTDAVVVEGAAYLRDGDTVRILDDREADSAVPGSDAGGLQRGMGSVSLAPGRG
jgi:multidrug efflux pump subunit AcrA (membrane-fusion protein)